jgi:hypothetical protein
MSPRASNLGHPTAGTIELDHTDSSQLVERKVTCPFVGSAVAQGKLLVRNTLDNPLARIEDLKGLGNSGGGDLGDLLVLFASGNHAFMKGSTEALDTPAPDGLFSLEFPGSQGSHPGHSGILQGDPRTIGSGRLSLDDFARLTRRATNGAVGRSDTARFIAENLHWDPDAKVFGTGAIAAFGEDLFSLLGSTAASWISRLSDSGDDAHAAHRIMETRLTKLLGDDNLVGSAGEYGLLFAFLANRPGAPKIDGEPALSLRDLQDMFVHKQLPLGWASWIKTRRDWTLNTFALLVGAGKEYRRLRDGPGTG